jgi:hypothetical protein
LCRVKAIAGVVHTYVAEAADGYVTLLGGEWIAAFKPDDILGMRRSGAADGSENRQRDSRTDFPEWQ